LGYGATANVHTLDQIRGVCCKINKPEDEIPDESFVNSPAEELNILSYLDKEHLSVRTPKPYCSNIIDLGKRKYLVMEQLNAVSVRDIFEGKEELPQLFDFESFFKKLEHFVVEMHEAGVYHRDLHEGNIMIDKVTGAPYVIDFGTGIKTFRGDEEPYNVPIAAGEYIKLLDDDFMLKGVKEKVKAKLLTK
jgi:serine/threonine protein kinase